MSNIAKRQWVVTRTTQYPDQDETRTEWFGPERGGGDGFDVAGGQTFETKREAVATFRDRFGFGLPHDKGYSTYDVVRAEEPATEAEPEVEIEPEAEPEGC